MKLDKIVYLSEDQFTELRTNETITVGDITENYDENTLYLTPVDQQIPVIYTDEAGTTTTNVLRIYVDADGNLQIKTS